MKFGQNRRTDKRTGAKSVLRFKSLLTGNKQEIQYQQPDDELIQVNIQEQQKHAAPLIRTNRNPRSRRGDPPGHIKIPVTTVVTSTRSKKDCSPSRRTPRKNTASTGCISSSGSSAEVEEEAGVGTASKAFTVTAEPTGTDTASFASLTSHGGADDDNELWSSSFGNSWRMVT